MRVEKEGSKSGGGYAGGFFQLFDWTAKSRKKLFSSKSDVAECSKQGEGSHGTLPVAWVHLMDGDETGAGSSIRGSRDYSCTSSIADGEVYGARAPGVVARLMGLDSLPTSNFCDSNSTPFLDTKYLPDASHSRKHVDYYHDHQIMHSGNLLNKEDGTPRNFVESKPQKVINRPLVKFQTEILPPKSAKSIPITHHKHLSPIKSPGFVPSETAMHIMEAASKMIEPSAKAASKAKMPVIGSASVPVKVRHLKEKVEAEQKMPLVGSSSVPMKVRDVTEKVEVSHKRLRLAEASQRSVESKATKYLKGQSLNKSQNGMVDITPLRASLETEDASVLKNKEKSISLAIQAKFNVQRREGLNSGSSRALIGQTEQCKAMASHILKSQPSIQKSGHRKYCAQNATGVLRQNNQKQNGIMDEEKPLLKPLGHNSQSRKVMSGNVSSGMQKTSGRSVGSKIGSRKLDLEAMDSERSITDYCRKNVPRNKGTIDADLHLKKNDLVDDLLIDNNKKGIQSSAVIDRHCSWAKESKEKGMDVVSFTFTAPLTRSAPGSETPGFFEQKNRGACVDNQSKRSLLDTDSMKLSSLGYNLMGGEALSALVNQKLRELTSNVKSSFHNSASMLQDLVPNINAGDITHMSHDNNDPNVIRADKLDSNCDSDLFSSASVELRLKHMFQGIDERKECTGEHNDSSKLLDPIRPSPVSIFETTFSTESSCSLDSTDSGSTEGGNYCFSIRDQEFLGLRYSKMFQYADTEMELSDSASSTSTGTALMKGMYTLAVPQLGRSTNWDIQYVGEILFSLDSMCSDFAFGQAHQIINPSLFDQLEKRRDGLQSDNVEARLERKLLFDCVSKCLDIRYQRYANVGFRTWVKGVELVRNKEWLANEVLKEMSTWRGMGDCMVDELVDKDMSSHDGAWLDFEVDAFTVGAEIEGLIFNSLVNEVVADITRYC